MDRQTLLKQLRQKLEDLSGRTAGRNKDDAQEALSLVRGTRHLCRSCTEAYHYERFDVILVETVAWTWQVEALSVQVTQRENELSQQQSELRQTAAQFHQVCTAV